MQWNHYKRQKTIIVNQEIGIIGFVPGLCSKTWVKANQKVLSKKGETGLIALWGNILNLTD